MKILAQDGYGPADKIESGLNEQFIQGALLSPRYRRPEQIHEKLEGLLIDGSELYFDPKFHASQYIGKPNAKLGKLEEWNYFDAPRRSSLITGSAITPMIKKTLLAQASFPVTGYIGPNIYVEDANSIDAGIALSVISKTKPAAEECDLTNKPVYASLAFHRDVLSNDKPFNDMVEALTSLETQPDGLYILIGSGSVDDDGNHVRSDIYHDHVIAGWMYLNYALSINGFNIINGYSDLLSPLLGICGAYAGATGWFGSLRQFSMGRYIKPPTRGGQTPLIRYVSNALMARIKQTDYDDYKQIDPRVTNNLTSDAYYAYGHEITRCEEVLQTWDAINEHCSACISDDICGDLDGFASRIEQARHIWSNLEEAGFTGGIEAQLEKLDALENGISLFKQWAELI